MAFKKAAAIVDEFRLEKIEPAPRAHGVSGFSMYSVKGRGHYFNSFKRDGLVAHTLICVYTSEKHVKAIVQVIMNAADTGVTSEVLVAISPVDEMYWIKGNKPISEYEFNCLEVDHD